MVGNSTRGQLKRKHAFLLSPFAPENLVSRDGLGHPVLHHSTHSLCKRYSMHDHMTIDYTGEEEHPY